MSDRANPAADADAAAKRIGYRWSEYMPLSKLRPAKRNPKEHALDDIGGSLARFGMGEAPMLDERTGRLVAGHGRREELLAKKKAGEPPPAGVVAIKGEWYVPVQRGWKSKNDEEAEAYLLASNRTSEIGGWSAELASVLAGHAGDLSGIGFTAADLERIAQQSAAPVEFPAVPDHLGGDYRCPKCGYEWSGTAEAQHAATAKPRSSPKRNGKAKAK